MRLSTLLLAGAVLPFVLSWPVEAAEVSPERTTEMLLAQADNDACPEGQECPPAEEQTPAEKLKNLLRQRQEQQEQAAPQQPGGKELIDRLRRRQQQLQEQQAAPEQQPPEQEQAAPEPAPAQEPQQQAAPEPQPEPEQQAAPEQAAPEQPAATEERRPRRRRPPEQQQEQAAPQQPAPEQPQQTETQQAQPEEDTTVEQQLEAQGDREEAQSVRRLRDRLLEQLLGAPAAEQAPTAREGDRRDRTRRDRRERNQVYERDADQGRVVERRGGRIIVDLGGGDIYVEPDVPDEGGRLLYGADNVDVQQLPGGATRTTVYRRNGVEITTVRDRYGEIVLRTKRLRDGTQIVLIDNRFANGDERRRRRPVLTDVPPPRVSIPRDRYIVDLGRASRDDLRYALQAPPVQQLDRRYTLDEVLRNEQVRAYSPRIDLDTITFDFGSATIGVNQMQTLFDLGQAMEEIIAETPEEVYLIEGHTDAVGSDYDNLLLSDRRAEAVAVALSQNFDIPPENLITEGYGEQYLKVPTEQAERLNRRATVRRLTELLAQQN